MSELSKNLGLHSQGELATPLPSPIFRVEFPQISIADTADRRHVDARGRLIICRRLNRHSSKSHGIEQDWPRTLGARGLIADNFSEKFLRVLKTYVYQHHISDYSSDVLATWAAVRLARPFDRHW